MDIPTPAHIAAVRARLEDEAELVRASAIWALGQMTDMSGAEILNMVGARGPLVDEELAQLGN
jgi:HEAT repeat protein